MWPKKAPCFPKFVNKDPEESEDNNEKQKIVAKKTTNSTERLVRHFSTNKMPENICILRILTYETTLNEKKCFFIF